MKEVGGSNNAATLENNASSLIDVFHLMFILVILYEPGY